MMGIYLKDFLVISHKHSKIRYVMDTITVVAFLFILSGKGALVLPYILVPIEVLSIIVTLTANDEETRWERYAIALPVKRTKIVLARYLYVLSVLGLGTLLSLLLNIGAYFLFHDYKLILHIMASLGVFILTLLLASILLLSSYLSGANATFIMLAVSIIFLLVITFVTDRIGIDLTKIIVDNFNLFIAGSIGISFLLSLSCFGISIWAFARKNR